MPDVTRGAVTHGGAALAWGVGGIFSPLHASDPLFPFMSLLGVGLVVGSLSLAIKCISWGLKNGASSGLVRGAGTV